MLSDISKKREHKIILLILLFVLGVVIFTQIRSYLGGFLGGFLGALTLYVILRKQMRTLVEKKGWNQGLSAIIILIEALFLFLIPLTGIAAMIIDKLSNITIDFNDIWGVISSYIESIEQRFGIDIFKFDNLSFLPQLGSNIVQVIASNSYSFVINILVIIFVLYFLLYSYKEFEQIVKETLPFSEKNKKTFLTETQSIIKANAIGIPLLGILQGLFAYVGYLIFGVSSPELYAIITAFATILPIVGAAIIYVPLSIVLLIGGNIGAGIGLLIYSIVIVGSVDNVARFLLQKRLANIHPLITVFGVLIGLPMFGFWGVIFGPLVLSLFVLFFKMYRNDYMQSATNKTYQTEFSTSDFANEDSNEEDEAFDEELENKI